ncbi:Serine/threonine-protein phosphatase 2A regulatory subunit B'' subunit alpha [Batrachochytrium dendrobatidis]|nr:Serine/threonine-protein phosphatase 2A regulatory subunit B'' subunit alpha [Batrachochytrium dendrobatidis]KAK5671844.1 Serine/threonine-protein phosphatase 2A regulatory subunit B'' subunit alpha [Batrachochytrium dendrobatidis]
MSSPFRLLNMAWANGPCGPLQHSNISPVATPVQVQGVPNYLTIDIDKVEESASTDTNMNSSNNVAYSTATAYTDGDASMPMDFSPAAENTSPFVYAHASSCGINKDEKASDTIHTIRNAGSRSTQQQMHQEHVSIESVDIHVQPTSVTCTQQSSMAGTASVSDSPVSNHPNLGNVLRINQNYQAAENLVVQPSVMNPSGKSLEEHKRILNNSPSTPRSITGSKKRLAAFHRQIQQQDIQNALHYKGAHAQPISATRSAESLSSECLYQNFISENPSEQLTVLYKTLQSDLKNAALNTDMLGMILQTYGVPVSFRGRLMERCVEIFNMMNADGQNHLANTVPQIHWYHVARLWKTLLWETLDVDQRCFALLKPSSCNHLLQVHIETAVADVIRDLPSFAFLVSSQSFMSRYVETVATRLFLMKSSSFSPTMTLREFRKLEFVLQISQLERCATCLEPSVPRAFSYKDFYVIYCKFWELDLDHDMILLPTDIQRFENYSLSPLMVSRIFQWNQIRALQKPSNSTTMDFREFVVFIICVMGKTTDYALVYWFRCLDLDGDGVLSLMELESFWFNQTRRIREQYSLVDFFSIVSDMLLLGERSHILLSDFKKNRDNTGIFLDLLFDSQQRIEFLRRTSDIAFRRRDEVWTNVSVFCANHDKPSDTIDSWEVRRIKLHGWDKFSEKCYRKMTQTRLISDTFTNIGCTTDSSVNLNTSLYSPTVNQQYGTCPSIEIDREEDGSNPNGFDPENLVRPMHYDGERSESDGGSRVLFSDITDMIATTCSNTGVLDASSDATSAMAMDTALTVSSMPNITATPLHTAQHTMMYVYSNTPRTSSLPVSRPSRVIFTDSQVQPIPKPPLIATSAEPHPTGAGLISNAQDSGISLVSSANFGKKSTTSLQTID